MHLILYQVDIRTRSNSKIRMICLFIEYTDIYIVVVDVCLRKVRE